MKTNQNKNDDRIETRQKLPTLEQTEKLRNQYANRRKFVKTLASTTGILLVIAGVAVLLTTFFFPVLKVSGQSMEPTLQHGDILLLSSDSGYRHGDLVGIAWENKILIKRVIGLPGDQINIDPEGNVYVNGQAIDEPYVVHKSLGNNNQEYPIYIPDGKLFVLGDQRDTSIDSRNSRIGLVDKDQVIGHMIARLWPWTHSSSYMAEESESSVSMNSN